MDKEILKQADWCRESCPELAAFNKAYVIRNGGGLIPYIELHGSHDDIIECVKREVEFFAKTGIVKTERFLTKESKDDPERSMYLFANGQKSQHRRGSLYFYENQCDERLKNVFHIDGCAIHGKINYLASTLHMEISELTDILEKHKDWMKCDLKKMVNQVLIHHYMYHDDDRIVSDDFEFLSKLEMKNVAPSSVEHRERQAEVSNELSMEKKTEKPDLKDTVQNEVQKDIPKESENGSKTEAPKVQAGDKKEESDDSDIEPEIPVPKEKKKQTITGVMKEELTDEEKRENTILVDNLTTAYEAAIKYIQSLKTNKWKFIINKMNDAIKHKKFTVQWCPLYLEVSDDISDPLYRQLYDLDNATKEFNQKIVHQIKHLVCPVCGAHWDEDITFVEPGLHDVECPSCYSGRRYEKV